MKPPRIYNVDGHARSQAVGMATHIDMFGGDRCADFRFIAALWESNASSDKRCCTGKSDGRGEPGMDCTRVLIYCPIAPKRRRSTPAPSRACFGWNGRTMRLSCSGAMITRQRNTVTLRQSTMKRSMALAGGFDALLLVENDMILPPDALLKMAAVDADVVCGLYVNRHGWRK